MRFSIILLVLTASSVWSNVNNNEVNDPVKNNPINELNTLVNQLREQMQHDQDRYKLFEQQNSILKDQNTLFKNQLENLTNKINEQQTEIKAITDNKLLEIPHSDKALNDLNLDKIAAGAKNFQQVFDTLKETYEKQIQTELLSAEEKSERELVIDLTKQSVYLSNVLAEQMHYASDQRTFFKNELDRVTGKVNEQVNELKSITEKNQLDISSDINSKTVEELEKIDTTSAINSLKNIDEWIKKELQHVEELEKMAAFGNNLKTLVNNNDIPLETIKELIRKEIEKDLENHIILNDNLKDWQKMERSKIHDKLKQSDVTIEEYKEELNKNNAQLEIVAKQYETTVEEVKKWILEEFDRQKNSEVLASWQINVRNWLQQSTLVESLTPDEFEKTIKNERNHIIKLAVENFVTVKKIEDEIRNAMKHKINSGTEELLKTWQQNEQSYLLSLIHTKQITKNTNFEDFLTADKLRMEKIASTYSIKVDDIIEFWRKEYQHLQKLKIISESPENNSHIAEWQRGEETYVQYLLEDTNLSIEELEKKLKFGNARLKLLAKRYNLTLTDIEEWYLIQLQKLIQMEKFHLEKLEIWRNRLTTVIVHQQMGLEELKTQYESDREVLEQSLDKTPRLDSKSYGTLAETRTPEDSILNFIGPMSTRLKVGDFQKSENEVDLKVESILGVEQEVKGEQYLPN